MNYVLNLLKVIVFIQGFIIYNFIFFRPKIELDPEGY